MSPSHANKKGVRYLYYLSPAGLRKHAAGVGRVPAPELEALVVDAVRRHLQGDGADPKPIPETDRELIERHLLRVTLSAKEVTLRRMYLDTMEDVLSHGQPLVVDDRLKGLVPFLPLNVPPPAAAAPVVPPSSAAVGASR